MTGMVAAVSRSAVHELTKDNAPAIRLLPAVVIRECEKPEFRMAGVLKEAGYKFERAEDAVIPQRAVSGGYGS